MKYASLADRAALWKLKVSKLTVYKRDKKATQLVADANEGRKVGNFNKKLFDGCGPVEKTLDAYGAVYAHWFNNTAPYMDYEGERLIRSDKLIDCMREFGVLKAEAELQLSNLIPAWQGCIAWDLNRLKHLGNPADYPDSPEQFFSIYSQMRPVPSATDFRFDIPEEEKAALAQAEQDAAAQAQKYALETLMVPMQAFIRRASEYTGEKGQRWHDSIVTNIKDVAEAAKGLNIMGDPNIDALIADLEALWLPISFAPSVVKESVAHRDQARDELEAIMKRMSAYAGSM